MVGAAGQPSGVCLAEPRPLQHRTQRGDTHRVGQHEVCRLDCRFLHVAHLAGRGVGERVQTGDAGAAMPLRGKHGVDAGCQRHRHFLLPMDIPPHDMGHLLLCLHQLQRRMGCLDSAISPRLLGLLPALFRPIGVAAVDGATAEIPSLSPLQDRMVDCLDSADDCRQHHPATRRFHQPAQAVACGRRQPLRLVRQHRLGAQQPVQHHTEQRAYGSSATGHLL